MTSNLIQSRLWTATLLVSGFVAGYFFFDHSAELRVLRYRLAGAEAALKAAKAVTPGRATAHWAEAGAAKGNPSTLSTSPMPPFITEEDVKTSLEMNDRARHGEYMLQFERPVDRKTMQDAIKKFSVQIGSNNAPKLDAIFAQLGVPAEAADQLKTHQQKIAFASLEAEQGIQQVLAARNDYDTRLRALLTGDVYSAYRQYEASQASVREYDGITAYASQNNLQIDPAYASQIQALIQGSQAYTLGWWHGPYDILPPIGVGQEMITQQLFDQIGQITQAAGELKQNAATVGLPDQYVTLLDGYYSQVIQAKQRTIAQLNPQPVASTK
jgi:hypothetical protein